MVIKNKETGVSFDFTESPKAVRSLVPYLISLPLSLSFIFILYYYFVVIICKIGVWFLFIVPLFIIICVLSDTNTNEFTFKCLHRQHASAGTHRSCVHRIHCVAQRIVMRSCVCATQCVRCAVCWRC